ncbi:MAG: hypothetical protein MZV64_32565 [Ignavibacteriales bacterium]|nr:hypothetical protein [Ignavibacteriales bacterium]
MTITGMTADYRMRLRPDVQLDFILSLINALNKNGAGIPINVGGYTLENISKQFGLNIRNS